MAEIIWNYGGQEEMCVESSATNTGCARKSDVFMCSVMNDVNRVLHIFVGFKASAFPAKCVHGPGRQHPHDESATLLFRLATVCGHAQSDARQVTSS